MTEIHEVVLDSDEGTGVYIGLDGTVGASLDWAASIHRADKLAAEGKFILWNLDMGLFQHLPHSLDKEAQLLTLKFTIDHFRETIWEKFKHCTLGVIIYKGDALFKDLGEQALPFSDSLAQAYHRRNVAAEYLSHLTALMPESLRIYLWLSVDKNLPLSIILALLNPDKFERIEWIIDADHPLHSSWQQRGNQLHSLARNLCSTGFCIPFSEWMPLAGNAVDDLLREQTAIRLVPESALLSNWDQLDKLFVLEKFVTPFGKRQLLGFKAAGGEINYLQKKIE